MSGDAFQKIKDSTNRAITKVGVKTSSFLEKSKIKMHIESLTKEIQKLFVDIGEEVYSLWLQGNSSNQEMLEKLETVKSKKTEIEQLMLELGSIDDRDNVILGTKIDEAKEEHVNRQKPCCPNCGSECDASAKFCRKCGYKLQ